MGKGKRKGKVAQRHGFDSSGRLGHDSTYRVNVSELSALAVDTFIACMRVICDLTADGDLGEYRGRDRIDPPSRIIRRPMDTMTRRAWLWTMAATMFTYNGTYVDRGTLRDAEGVPLSLVPIAPPRVSIIGSGTYLDGESIDPDRLVWVPRMTFPTVTGYSAWGVNLARSIIGAAWAANEYRADFWEAGGAPVTVLTSDQYLNNDQAGEIADRWVERRTAEPGKPAVLSKGAHAELFGADVATKGAADASERLGTGIARWAGVPAWLVNVPSAAGSMTYSNAAAAGLDLVRYTLRPGYAGPISDLLSDTLPGGAITGRRAVLGLDHLTHGTMLERFQAYAIATRGAPWMDPGEVREELHLPVDPTFSLDPAGAPAPAMEAIPNA